MFRKTKNWKRPQEKKHPEKRLLQLRVEGHLGGSTSGSAPRQKTMGLTGLDMVEIYGNLWKSMEIHGNLWKSMEIYGNLWKSMVEHV